MVWVFAAVYVVHESGDLYRAYHVLGRISTMRLPCGFEGADGGQTGKGVATQSFVATTKSLCIFIGGRPAGTADPLGGRNHPIRPRKSIIGMVCCTSAVHFREFHLSRCVDEPLPFLFRVKYVPRVRWYAP